MALQSTTAIASVVLQATAPSVTFSGIPNIYRDLILVVNGTTAGDFVARMTFNSDTNTSNYLFVSMFGFSGGTASGAAAETFIGNYSTGLRGTNIVQIIDYSATDKHKTYLTRSSNSADIIRAWCSRWANTTPINSLTFSVDGANTFAIGSTFSLYGRIA